MRKKIIILYSTAGMGHKKAAIAIHEAFKAKAPDVEVKIVDVLEYAGKVYRFLYLDFYVFMMQRAKWLWALLYYVSNIPFVDILTRRLRGYLDYVGMRPVSKMLVEEKPDAVIATHFFLPNVADILVKNKDLKAKLFTLITDYGPHSFWLSGHIDKYFVGTESMIPELVGRGIPKEKIIPTGIATISDFRKEFNVLALKKEYGLDESKKTIFLMSGGFGVGPIEKILLSLNACRADIQVITVCGHNKVVHEEIKRLKEKLKYPLVLFGFTDKVAELMAASNIMITKAGGISVTEALDSRLPMILFGSIPGQETWNEKFLITNGAAQKADKVKDIPLVADNMLLSDEVYALFKENIEKIRKPLAAEKIVDVMLGEI